MAFGILFSLILYTNATNTHRLYHYKLQHGGNMEGRGMGVGFAIRWVGDLLQRIERVHRIGLTLFLKFIN